MNVRHPHGNTAPVEGFLLEKADHFISCHAQLLIGKRAS